MLLKAAPQDLPCSQRLLVQILFLYLLSDLLAVGSAVESGLAMAMILLNIAIILIFTYFVLLLLRLKLRYVQTVSAIVGTGIIFNLFSWPLLLQLSVENTPESAIAIVSLLVLLLMSWDVLVTAHIYRNALGSGMVHALLLSFSLLFVSITLSKLIFSEQ